MTQDLASWLALNVCQRMRTDIIGRFIRGEKGKKAGYQQVMRPLESDDIENHLYKNQPLGLYLMRPETDGYVQVAIVDIDDKEKKLTWDELVTQAKLIDEQLGARLLLSWPCRSGGGHGIHLWLFWKDPQPAKIVRQQLLEAVVAAGTPVHVDIFPAQDNLGNALGNLVALPFGRASRPLDLATGVVLEDIKTFLCGDPTLSAPVIAPVIEKQKAVYKMGHRAPTWVEAADNNTGTLDDYGPPDPEMLREALRHVPNTDYHTWLRVGLGLRNCTEEGLLDDDTAFDIWDSWSSSASNYDPREQDYQWGRFRPKPGGVSLGTLWWLARENGWRPTKEELDPVPVQLPRVQAVQKPQENVALPRTPTVVAAHELETNLQTEPGEVMLPMMGGRLGSAGGDPLDQDPIDVAFSWWEKLEGAPQEVKDLNVRHFMAFDGGKAAVFKEVWDPVMHRQHLERVNVHDFKIFYQNQQVLLRTTRSGQPVYKPLGDMWVESPYRRQYKKIVLRPEGCSPGEYNLWRGWTLKPSEEGSWSILQEHIRDNLCQGNIEAYEYVLNWWALTFQHPETPIGVALVLRGGRGTGKSSFVRAFGEIFGQHFLHVVNSRSIVGHFNSHLRDCALLFADEAVWAGNRSEESTLKGIITEPTLTIEGKGRDSINCRNMIHLVIATNHDWAVPAGMDERRFCVLEVGEGKKQDSGYFRLIQKQLREGGQARLLHDMLTRDISKFDPAKVPITKEMTKQKILSLEPWAAWWYDCLMNGQLHEHQQNWEDETRVDLVFESYAMFVKLSSFRSGPCTPQSLTNHVRKVVRDGLVSKRVRLTSKMRIEGDPPWDKMVTIWKMPDLLTCRGYFELLLGDRLSWTEIDQVMIGKSNFIQGDDKTLI